MNCRRAQKWMSLDVDGELSPRRKTMLESHVAGCQACQEAKQLWKRVGDQFRAQELPIVQTPEAAWADVRRAIRNSETAGAIEENAPVWGHRWAWATAALAVLAVGVISLSVTLKSTGPGLAAAGDPGGATVEWVETSLPGATSMVYEDEETGWVVIWVVEANREENGHAGT